MVRPAASARAVICLLTEPPLVSLASRRYCRHRPVQQRPTTKTDSRLDKDARGRACQPALSCLTRTGVVAAAMLDERPPRQLAFRLRARLAPARHGTDLLASTDSSNRKSPTAAASTAGKYPTHPGACECACILISAGRASLVVPTRAAATTAGASPGPRHSRRWARQRSKHAPVILFDDDDTFGAPPARSRASASGNWVGAGRAAGPPR
jgi:hypothetical protein